MPNVFRFEVRQEDVVIRWLGSFATLANERMGEGLERSGKILVDTAKQITQEEGALGATKGYYNGWKFSLERGRSDRRTGFLYNEADHAYFAEKGRKAGRMPPQQAIEEWMRFKGIPLEASFVVRRAIARKGTIKRKGYGGFEVLDKTYVRAGRDVFEELELGLDRAMRDMR